MSARRQTLEERAAEMKQRKEDVVTAEKEKKKLQAQLEKVAGMKIPLQVHVIPPNRDHENVNVPQIVERLNLALKELATLTPDEIFNKISSLTDVLHLKLQLQVSDALDKLHSLDPDVQKDALRIVDSLMPHINAISTMKTRMIEALGIGENKNKLPNGQSRTRLTLPASTQTWESQYGDTVPPKSVN